jgi:anthranilate synthase component 1
VDAELPFSGGWFLFLGYELAQQIEPSLQLSPSATQPIAFATRVPLAIILDRQSQVCTVVAESGHEAELQAALDDLRAVGQKAPERSTLPQFSVIEDAPEHFLRAIDTAKRYIAAGDVFQANLSRCWRVDGAADVDPVELYLRLRESNPSPFGGLMQQPGFTLVSSSPERLVRRRGRRVDTRPIAGTRPRSAETRTSDSQKQELLGHPKERAEHIMLIDLERNDLGRVCVGGSVNVDEYMVIESYSHVHHIVSNVTGTAREDLLPGELIRAVFPGGTITGCPKVRCMEIIHELEQRPRGAYTGSMGYLNRNGDCDLNILIRTMSVSGNQLEIAAGSGIVADSEPQHELEETRAKAKGLLMALESES